MKKIFAVLIVAATMVAGLSLQISSQQDLGLIQDTMQNGDSVLTDLSNCTMQAQVNATTSSQRTRFLTTSLVHQQKV